MKAMIRRDIQLSELKWYGFRDDGAVMIREVKHPLYLVVDKKTRELVLLAPMGPAVYMEAHRDKFGDLIEAGLVHLVLANPK